MTPEELQLLTDSDVEALIREHEADDPAEFAMQFHGRKDLPVRAMAEQIAARRKASKKLPMLSRHQLLYTTISLEQASGERTARYKASLTSGVRLIDLSGGLGIDALFFAGVFQEVVYCERDALLSAIARHNFQRAGVGNIEVTNAESIEHLASYPDNHFDWIYLDPARREHLRRSVALEASSPDVVACHDLLLRKARRVMVKASPAVETSTLKALLPALSSIIVLSVDGECRETLLLLDRDAAAQPESVSAVCLSTGSDAVKRIVRDSASQRVTATALKACFYEPDPAIIKARVASELASGYGLEFVNHTVDYLVSDTLIESFPGRGFRMVECVPYKPKTFKAFLKRNGISGASIQRRDFPLSSQELRKLFRLRESDRNYLFFTRDAEGSAVCFYCVKPSLEEAQAPLVQDRSEVPEC
ncbi:MAG: class I SAM-dependent methyltransferase [Chlorobiaceae bacterium]